MASVRMLKEGAGTVPALWLVAAVTESSTGDTGRGGSNDA
jgi:hypothetical protein